MINIKFNKSKFNLKNGKFKSKFKLKGSLMCVLCGELVSALHWSDLGGNGLIITVGDTQGQRLKSRLKKVKYANEILSFYALKLSEWQNSKYILSNKTGKSVIVNDLGDLWSKAESMLGRNLDILEPKLLEHIKQCQR